MLTLIIRAIGQLPVGRKLLLIYLLDLTAVIYVSSILINEKYLSIDFSRKEVAGNAYVAAVRDVLVALPTPLPDVSPVASAAESAGTPGTKALSVRLDPTAFAPRMEALRAAEQQYGPSMKTADVHAAFLLNLQSVLDKPNVDVKQMSAVLGTGRELITRIGNQSNLILDPDLDSYYTMSLVLLRFPELQELLGLTLQKAVELSQSDDENRNRLQTELLILEGRLDSVQKGIESDYDEALAAGPPTLATALTPTRTRLPSRGWGSARSSCSPPRPASRPSPSRPRGCAGGAASRRRVRAGPTGRGPCW